MARRTEGRITLELSPDALHEVREIQRALEPMLAKEGELGALADWGSKYVGAVIRIAGILHMTGYLRDRFGHQIEAETIKSAHLLGEYYKACAINVFTEMGTDQTVADAIYLLGRIRHLNQEEVSERELFSAASRGRFPTMGALGPALDRLIDHGYLIPVTDTKPTGGRPTSPRYTVVAESQKGDE